MIRMIQIALIVNKLVRKSNSIIKIIFYQEYQFKMGCASGKPESHTKKPTELQESSRKKPINSNNSQENPELKNESKPIGQEKKPSLPSNVNPIHTPSQTQPTNPTIVEPIRNSTVLQPQAQKTNRLKQSQAKKIQTQPIKQVKVESTLPILTPTKDIHGQAYKKNLELSVIPQRTNDFESLKKPQSQHIQNLKVDEKKEETKNSARNQLRISIPDMDDDFLVSKITKNNHQAEKIQNQSSHNKKQLEKSDQKIYQNQEIKDIRTDEIKINIMENHESRLVVHSSNSSSLRPDQFAALNQEQFDLNCEFDPNTLVIDMNKVAW